MSTVGMPRYQSGGSWVLNGRAVDMNSLTDPLTKEEPLTTITITVPAAVWDDYLDPMSTGMEAELELDEPTYRKVGKGGQFIYRDVSVDIAEELAGYLDDRAGMLLNQGYQDDDAERSAARRAIKLAEQIRDDVKTST